MRCIGIAACLLFLVAGCGDAASGVPGPSLAGAGGALTDAGASGSSQGVASAGEEGTSRGGSGGGDGSDGGSSADSPGGAAGANDCAVWPRHQLMPTIGPLFYGPDPGPCTETNTSSTSQTVGTYSFDDTGRVEKIVYANSTRDYHWTEDTLSSITVRGSDPMDNLVASYTWSETMVTEKVPGTGESIREYFLDTAGYPTELWVTDQSSGARRLRAAYTYVDCRLTHREAFNADSSADPTQTADYEYDALGHMSARNGMDGTKSVFDYACWR